MQCDWWTGGHTTNRQIKEEWIPRNQIQIGLYRSFFITLFLSHATALNREDNVSSFAFHHSKYCLLLCLLTRSDLRSQQYLALDFFFNTKNEMCTGSNQHLYDKKRESFNFLVSFSINNAQKTEWLKIKQFILMWSMSIE